MVCGRCIHVVREELEKQGLHPLNIELGFAIIEEESISPSITESLVNNLEKLGFELLDTTKAKVLERVKRLIINKIHHQDRLDLKVNWSDLISETLHQDYNSISSLFSSVEGITIEHYIIKQKIEKAKELICYDEKNLSEIAFQLAYSSVQHLSTQFKKVTGQTPSQFKKMRYSHSLRKSLDSI